jgi:hypothetical protein
VPELPVMDVERAQQYYKDALGFEIGWLYQGKEIGAVSRDRAAIFFRKRKPPFEPAIHWVFVEDIDALYQELQSLGANIGLTNLVSFNSPFRRSPLRRPNVR